MKQTPVYTGIIAEFNPFHNGHAALAAAAQRESHAVVAVMSGNYVQRGSLAITDKRVRSKAALHCGIDLVLELPVVYATAPAHRFAHGAVEILAATGCVNRLIFGSETGDTNTLTTLAKAVDDPSVQPVLRKRLQEGMTFSRAREQAVARLLGAETAAKLALPNNALAVEYLRAAHAHSWNPHISTVQRVGTDHDSMKTSCSYASGSFLRKHAANFSLLRQYVPAAAWHVYEDACSAGLYPSSPAKLDAAVMAHLRRLRPAELGLLPDLSEGLENRLYASIRRSTTLPELLAALKTKRYTMARVRRLVLAAFLGLSKDDAATPPPYIRVLGFTPRGKEVLSTMKRTCRLPVSHSLARLRSIGGSCTRFADLEEIATDLYALTLPVPPQCGYEYTASAIFLKK